MAAGDGDMPTMTTSVTSSLRRLDHEAESAGCGDQLGRDQRRPATLRLMRVPKDVGSALGRMTSRST
jgi:hypothetical protein